MDKYEVMEEGIGGEGLTLMHCETDQKKYVLKRIRMRKQTQRSKQTVMKEMAFLTRIQNPYLVAYKEVWAGKGCNLHIVMDYCEGGDMSDIIKEAKGSLFLETKICHWFVQLLLALNFLHSKHVLHGNLKSVHIVLSQIFGLLDMSGLISKINRSSISALPTIYSPSLKSLIKSMLRKNPDQRPTAAELLKHPHLQKYVAECITLPQLISCPSPMRRTSSRCKQRKSPEINGYSGSLSTERDCSLCSVPSREPSSTDVTECADHTVSSQPISFSANGGISNTPNHFISGTWNDQECNIQRSSSSTNSAKSIRLEPLPEDDNSFQFPKCPPSVSVTEEPPTSIRHRDASTKIELSYSSEFTTPSAATNYQERAEALESLLELCAQLLQQRKLSELAGVLKPFGKNGASPRETAIWLTKSMKAVGDKQHSS